MLRSPAVRRPVRPSTSGGTDGSRSVAHIDTLNSTASMAYATTRPTPVAKLAKISPAVSGPSTMAAWKVVKCSVLAAGTSDFATSLGTIACRVGELTAKALDCRATRPSSRSGLPTCSTACASSPKVASHITAELATSSSRRSTTSATAPPHKPKINSGSRAARPSRPTHSESSVNENISTGTATAVNWKPNIDTALPSHIRRYAGTRSGRTSIAQREGGGPGSGSLTGRSPSTLVMRQSR